MTQTRTAHRSESESGPEKSKQSEQKTLANMLCFPLCGWGGAFMQCNKLGRISYVLFSLSVACLFAYLTVSYTTKAPIRGDARQNARAAYHLVHTGVMGSDNVETPTPKPQLHREPVPILVIAGLLLVHPDFENHYTLAELTSGPLAKTAKEVNMLWRFVAALFMFLLCEELFSYRLLAAGAALVCLSMSEVLFFANPKYVDGLFTEIPAAALILMSSWSAVKFVRTKSIARAVWLGGSLAALALTKAAFFYIGMGFIGVLVALEGLKVFGSDAPRESLRQFSAAYVLLVLTMFAVNATWIARNYAAFGKPQMSDRAETILGYRLVLAEQRLLGQIYAFSPQELRRLIEPWMGYTPEDLTTGGRLEGLAYAMSKPADALEQRMKAEGFAGDKDEWVRRVARNFVIKHPLRYIGTIGVFAYKGAGFMSDPKVAASIGLNRTTLIILNAVGVLCLLGIFLSALAVKDQVLTAAFGVGAGSFLFMAMFTQALARFNAPITPLVILSLLWLLTQFVSLVSRLERKNYRGVETTENHTKLRVQPNHSFAFRMGGATGATIQRASQTMM
jgi:hypothetical protein